MSQRCSRERWRKHVRAELVIACGGLVVCLAIWIVMAWAEARAFNRATGKDVSVLDAMFLELRVEGTP